jgi:polysaccharide export outer membrane protein
MKESRLLVLMVGLAIPAMTTFGQTSPGKPSSDSKLVNAKGGTAAKEAVGDAAVQPATENPNYVIGPDDELIVTVWREPDISRTVPVRPDGKISLPLLKDVQAAGLTPMQLTSELTTRLAKFISAPEVTVIVSKVSPPRVFVVGEVGRAGAYPLVAGMTVLEALSSAGGLTPFAKQSKISIVRMENGKQIKISVNYKEIVKGWRPEQNAPLKAGDTVVVP